GNSSGAVQERTARLAGRRHDEQAAIRAKVEAERSRQPMSSLVMMDAIAKSLPGNVAIVDEATSTGHHYLERMGLPRDPYAHIAQRGWALGWGIGCTLGVKLAWPDRPVLGLIGDGAAMYG